MTSRNDVMRMCENLKSAVEVRPEEIAAPTRSVVLRVLGDFAITALMIREDALSQPLACNLENHNPSSAVSSFTSNRMILLKQVLRLLSKRSAQFTLMDVIKPDSKKFEKMVQQMLTYLYHSDRVYDIVEKACSDLDEKAAQVQRERETLDFESNELNVIAQRVKALTEARVAEVLAETYERKAKMEEESAIVQQDYEKLKKLVTELANEVERVTREAERRQERLEDLSALIVEDPDTCIKQLRELQEEVSNSKEHIATRERALLGASEHLQSVHDALERAKSIHNQAVLAASAREELVQSEKGCERRVAAQARALLELESQLGELKALVEARQHQLAKVQEEDHEVQASLLALEETERQLNEKLEKADAHRRHLLNETTKITGLIEAVQRTTVTTRENIMCQLSDGHNDQMKIWSAHVTQMSDFTGACHAADGQLEACNKQLAALSQAIEQLASTGNSTD